jgi:hypothetical protein
MRSVRAGWARASRRIAAAGDDALVLEVGDMRILRVSRLRRDLTSILRRGEVVAIERRGKIVAKLEPVAPFADHLSSMPDVGDDEDFARVD